MNLNKIFILGNLTRDPERRALPSGQAVCNFSVATNRFYTTNDGQKQQDTEFHNVVAFGKTAEIVSQYLKKGSLVLIEGRLKTRTWQDTSGTKHYKTEIITERLQLGPKSSTPSTANQQNGFNEEARNDNIPTIREEDIPIIEEDSQKEISKDKNNENPETNSNNAGKNTQNKKDEEDEIDVKDIPF